MSLVNKIRVNTQYTRSINLERDSESCSTPHAYVPTSRALDTLGRILSTMHDGPGPRAWALVGPYGSGKSAFGLFVSDLFGPGELKATQHAQDVLNTASPELAQHLTKLKSNSPGHCVAVLTGSPEPMGQRLVQALASAAEAFWQRRKGVKPAILTRLQSAAGTPEPTASSLLDLVADLQDALARAKSTGLLIIIDELGKFLEYEARHRSATDVYFLQAVAERAGRASAVPLHFMVLMHQAFEIYSQGFGEQLRNEWKKVQGRFEAIPFVESAEQTLRVVHAAITHDLAACRT